MWNNRPIGGPFRHIICLFWSEFSKTPRKPLIPWVWLRRLGWPWTFGIACQCAVPILNLSIHGPTICMTLWSVTAQCCRQSWRCAVGFSHIPLGRWPASECLDFFSNSETQRTEESWVCIEFQIHQGGFSWFFTGSTGSSKFQNIHCSRLKPFCESS
jgi:hypothetical protein